MSRLTVNGKYRYNVGEVQGFTAQCEDFVMRALLRFGDWSRLLQLGGALAVVFGVAKLPFIAQPVGINRNAAPVDFAGHPAAFIGAPIGIGYAAVSMGLPIRKCPHID